MKTLLEYLSARALNHLLTAAPWATQRLHQHAGSQFRIGLGGLRLDYLIDEGGLLRECVADNAPVVTIELPPQTPALALLDRSAIFLKARISGSAELAETLGLVFRNLSWDVEHDLARVFGDIVARRLAMGGRRLAEIQAEGARRLLANVGEYLTLEKRALPLRDEAASFARDNAALRDDLARLEKRVARLHG